MVQWDENVIRNIIKWKKDHGYTYKDISDKTGIKFSAIQRYLIQGSALPIRSVVRFAEIMGVSVHYLLGLTDNPSPYLPSNLQRLIDAYDVATDEDRAEIESILRKYLPQT